MRNGALSIALLVVAGGLLLVAIFGPGNSVWIALSATAVAFIAMSVASRDRKTKVDRQQR